MLHCGDKGIQLNHTEFELMRMLLQNREGIVSKETLLLKVWGYEARVETNVVETYISFLRKKLRHISAALRIEAVWRQGYHLKAGGV
jgi:DNA-binding response OmpR family regulator